MHVRIVIAKTAKGMHSAMALYTHQPSTDEFPDAVISVSGEVKDLDQLKEQARQEARSRGIPYVKYLDD